MNKVQLGSQLRPSRPTLRNNVPELRAVLGPYFVSSSTGIPPKSNGSTSGRIVMATNVTAPNALKPHDSAQIKLAAGTLTWTFATNFVNAPLVTWGVVGAPAAGAELYINKISNRAVQITSTNAADVRVLYLKAEGNPS